MEDTTMLDGSQPLFADLVFTIIPNSISDEQQRQLTDDIIAAGGTLQPFDAAHGRIEKLEDVTHIISTTSDFPDYRRALDLFKHVIKPSWVSASLQLGKVKNPRPYSPDPALYMADVMICCGNIPEGDKVAIEGGVLAAGGQYIGALSKQVTHLIALDLEDPRCQLAISKRLRIHIVLPHWFDDCLKLGRRISEGPYTLPNPEILNVRAGAIPAPRIIPQVRNATNPEPSSEPQPPSSAEYHEPARAIKAFKDKKVKFGEDLNLNDRLKGVIGELIRAGGGDVTDSLEAAYIYVCNYRDGADYVEASQKKKYVGNLSWLYYMITHDTWTDPMRRMLHYPRPRNGIPGFEKYKISISSYTGEARVYLENLVKASGAEFTKTFKQDNTHLITAHKQSEKCEAAEEWGVHVVNHLWLEESYARCKEQPLSRSQYVYFPGRTNLGEVIGQTEIDPDAVEKNYFSKNRKPTLTKGESGASTASAKRSAAKPTNEQNAQASTPLASKHTRTKRAAEATTPLPPSRIDGKENETPGTTGSRGAKNRALSKLHEAAPDIAKFEQEMKRKGGVVYGGRRDKEAEVADKKKKGRESTPSKRSIDEVDNDGESSADDAAGEAGQRAKKAKKEKLPPAKHRMVITKFDRWLNDPDKESRDKAALRELGIQIVADATKNVDLLCAPNIVRTEKFISALACGPTVVSTSYLEYALKNHKLPPAEKHLLQDKNYEQQHGFKLQEALERARQNKKRLLRDWTIFCTDDVPGGYDTFKGIITANGGTCQKWAGRPTGIRAVKRTIDESVGDISQNQEEDEGDVLYLISSDKPKNPSLWKKFRELAEKNDMVPRIVTTQWILFVVMAQYIHCDPQWELGEKTMKAKK